MILIVFNEGAKLIHGGALEWVHLVPGDLPIVAEQGMEQEREQAAAFPEHPEIGTGGQAIGGANEPLNGRDHRGGAPRSSSALFTIASPAGLPRSGRTPPASARDRGQSRTGRPARP